MCWILTCLELLKLGGDTSNEFLISSNFWLICVEMISRFVRIEASVKSVLLLSLIKRLFKGIKSSKIELKTMQLTYLVRASQLFRKSTNSLLALASFSSVACKGAFEK